MVSVQPLLASTDLRRPLCEALFWPAHGNKPGRQLIASSARIVGKKRGSCRCKIPKSKRHPSPDSLPHASAAVPDNYIKDTPFGFFFGRTEFLFLQLFCNPAAAFVKELFPPLSNCVLILISFLRGRLLVWRLYRLFFFGGGGGLIGLGNFYNISFHCVQPNSNVKCQTIKSDCTCLGWIN